MSPTKKEDTNSRAAEAQYSEATSVEKEKKKPNFCRQKLLSHFTVTMYIFITSSAPSSY